MLSIVVVPSLTPDCYNEIASDKGIRFVVVPSLTPDCYNCKASYMTRI